MSALRARLLCSPALICMWVATGSIAMAQDAAPQPPAATQDTPATTTAPATGAGSAPSNTTLPQVEVISAEEAPKPKKKTAAKKKAPVSSASQAIAPATPSEPVDPQPSAQATGQSNYDGVTNATSTVTDYVAPTSTVGSKTDTPLKLTPQSVSVVGKEQIRDQGVQNLSEAIRYVPGVLADGFGYDSRGDYSIIRGIPAAFFVDGLRKSYGYYINSAATEPYAMDRVEVLRGPASMLYGQVPTGGLVNGTSKLPSDVAYREIGVEYGSFDFKQVKLDMTGPLTTDGKWLYRVVGLAREAETQVDFVDNDRLMLAPSLTYRPTNDTSITLLGNIRRDDSGSSQQFAPRIGSLVPTINGDRMRRGTFTGDIGDHYDTDQESVSLMVDHKFSDYLKLHHGSRYSTTDNEYASSYAVVLTPARALAINNLLGGPILNPAFAPYLNAGQTELARARTENFTGTDVFNTDTNLTAKFSTGDINHKLIGGFDYTRYAVDFRTAGTLIDNLLTTSTVGFPVQPVFNLFNPGYAPPTQYLSLQAGFVSPDDLPFSTRPHEVQQQAGLYVQDELKFGGFTAVLGLRQDWLNVAFGSEESNDVSTTGRAALLYETSVGLTPYVSYSTSFAPLPGQPVGDNILVPFTDTRPAQPVEGEQIEIGVRYQPNGAPFIVSAAVYDLTDSNQTIQPDVLFQSVQGVDVSVRGFEIEAVGKIAEGLKVAASYSYTDATYEKYPELYPFPTGIGEFMKGKRVDGVPEHLASLWLIYTFEHGPLQGLSFGGGVRYVGETESFGRDIATQQELHVTSPSFTLFDAMVAYETSDWRWQLTAQNLEDEYNVYSCTAYRGDCAVGQARTIITGFTYKF